MYGLTRSKIVDGLPCFTGITIGFDKLIIVKYLLAALISVLTLLRILLKLAQSCGSFDLVALIF